MIRYALACVGDHAFEAWFSNSAAFDTQRKKHQVECPVCGSTKVRKQIMAPAVRTSRSSPSRTETPDIVAARIAEEVRQHIASTHVYVGDRFAEEARAMHAGDAPERPLWGEVTPDVARELIDEEVPAIPLPAAFVPRLPRSRSKLN